MSLAFQTRVFHDICQAGMEMDAIVNHDHYVDIRPI